MRVLVLILVLLVSKEELRIYEGFRGDNRLADAAYLNIDSITFLYTVGGGRRCNIRTNDGKFHRTKMKCSEIAEIINNKTR